MERSSKKDSAIITRRALSINIIDKDSLFIHADTLVATGPKNRRILRAYYGVRILKSDLRGKSDSLFLDESTGLTKLLSKPLTRQQEQTFTEAERNKKTLSFGLIKVKCQAIRFTYYQIRKQKNLTH